MVRVITAETSQGRRPRRWQVIGHQEQLHPERHGDVRGVERRRRCTRAQQRAPAMVPHSPSSSDSSRNIRGHRPPLHADGAQRADLPRALADGDPHRVHDPGHHDGDQDDRSARRTAPAGPASVHIMNDSSSSQVVTSSFCPVQSSRFTVSNFIQNARGFGLHHPVAGLLERLAQPRGQRAGCRRAVLGFRWICMRAGGVGPQLVERAQRLARARRRSTCSAGRRPWRWPPPAVDGVVGARGWSGRRDGDGVAHLDLQLLGLVLEHQDGVGLGQVVDVAAD